MCFKMDDSFVHLTALTVGKSSYNCLVVKWANFQMFLTLPLGIIIDCLKYQYDKKLFTKAETPTI